VFALKNTTRNKGHFYTGKILDLKPWSFL